MKTEFLSSLLKNKHNRILYVILIIGIVLMLLPGRAPAVRENPRTDRTDEEKLADIISAIDGAGKADVMITYYASATSQIVYDVKTRGDETDQKAVVSGGEAVSTGVSYPRVKGVVAVVPGAAREEIRECVCEAITVALDIPEYKVSVICCR